MARSSYIWVLEDDLGAYAAFTVKYEMEDYIARQSVLPKRITRVSDGCWSNVIKSYVWDSENKKVRG